MKTISQNFQTPPPSLLSSLSKLALLKKLLEVVDKSWPKRYMWNKKKFDSN